MPNFPHDAPDSVRLRLDSFLDGVDHINIYSRGVTQLGRQLSNFAHTPFECEDGRFASVEGYWYWLGCDPVNRPEVLRRIHGYRAKKEGRLLREKIMPLDEDVFRRKIKAALRMKIAYHERLAGDLRRSRLPFVHYYTSAGRVIVPSSGAWICQEYEAIRAELQATSRFPEEVS
jgi:hypothetical protein